MANDKEPANGGDTENGHTALTTSQTVLQYFWDLASYDENVRVTAARGLVADVIADQAKHAATLGKDSEAAPEDGAPKIRQLEYHLRRCSPTMVYTLRRLARGLSSSRAAARQGYATALAGLLGAAAAAGGGGFIGTAGMLVLLEVCIDGPTKGGDAKDTLLGRVFGYGCLLRSGLPLEQPTLASLLGGLLEAGSRKSFLREAATAVAMQVAARLEADTVAAALAAAPGGPLAVALAAPPAEATPESLLLALALWPKLPPAALKTCKLLPAGTPPPPPELYAPPPAGGDVGAAAVDAAAVAATAAGLFSRQHLTAILPVLLATSASHPRLHTLWQYLLPLLLPGYSPHHRPRPTGQSSGETAAAAAAAAAAEPPAAAGSAGGGKKAAKAAAKAAAAAKAKASAAVEGRGVVSGPLLAAFWEVVVEGGLMGSSHERRYLGFQLFSRTLPFLRPEHVATVFSPNLTRTLVNSLQRNDTYLHASAKKLMDGITSFLERSGGEGEGADPAVKMAVAAALQRLGGMAPKELAGGKLTQKLVQGLDASGTHRYVASLTEAFHAGRPPLTPGGEPAAAAEGDEERSAEQVAAESRAQCLEQLLAALKFPGAPAEDVAAGLRFMALHAFAELQAPKAAKSKIPEVASAAAALAAAPPLAVATRRLCAARLVTLVSHLCNAAAARLRSAHQQQHQQAKKAAAGDAGGGGGGANDGPAAKKRKTSGAAEEPPVAAAAAAAATSGNPNQPLHDTLAFVRKVLAAPGVAPAAQLGDAGEASLALLSAVEEGALAALPAAESAATAAADANGGDKKGPGKGDKKDGKKAKQQPEPEPEHAAAGGGGPAAARLRSLAALAGQLTLALLAEPEGFESDLPLGLRRVAAEGLGLAGLPEVEEVEEDEPAAAAAENGGGAAAPWSDVLVDVLLALAARPTGQLPTAPLREAGEALWRGCCEGLGPAGLGDLVRVVAAGGKGAGQDDAGLFESEDEEEEDEEEDEEDESEDEEEGESEDEEEEEEEEGKAAAARKRKAREGADEEEEGEEEEEDEGMDDEAMFRMDDKLAAYFRSLAAGRAGGAAAAERAAALVNFRLRALALIEVFAKKSPTSPLLLSCLVPLLRALATASRPGGQPQVADRLRAVLSSRLCKARSKLDLAALGGLEGYVAALKRLLYEASRNRDKPVAATAMQAYAAMLRAGAAAAAEQPEAAEAARASFRAALNDLLASKKTRLQPDGLVASFRAAPSACLPALGHLLAAVAEGRNAQTRTAAAALAASVLKAQPEGLAAALTAGGGGVGGALGGAMAAAAAGVGLKRKLHAEAAKAAVSLAESLKRLLPGKRAAEVMGAEKVNAIAKAIATVQSLGPPSKVSKPLKRLADAMALGPLLDKTKPDPALAARIAKARPAEEAAGAAAAEGKGGKEEGKKEGKDGKKGGKEKGKQEAKEQGKKQKGEGKAEREQAAQKRKAEQEEEEDDSDGDEAAEEEEEEESASEPGSSSGREDSDESGDDDEDEDDDEEEEEEEKAGRKRGASGRGGKGQGKGRPGGGGGRGSKGGKAQRQKGGRGGGGRGGGRGGTQAGGKPAGGSPAKKARR